MRKARQEKFDKLQQENMKMMRSGFKGFQYKSKIISSSK